MKRKMTKKELRAIADYKIGYCNAYYLLYGVEPFGYTAGVYGWDSDAYSLYIDGIGHDNHLKPFCFNLLKQHKSLT